MEELVLILLLPYSLVSFQVFMIPLYKAKTSHLPSVCISQCFQGALGKVFNEEFRAQLPLCITSTFS